MSTFPRLGLIFSVPLLVGVVLFTPRLATSSGSQSTAPTAHRPARIDRVAEDSDASVDLHGNDVTNAVARYSLDPGGAQYEVHSPQTELPRLASPKS